MSFSLLVYDWRNFEQPSHKDRSQIVFINQVAADNRPVAFTGNHREMMIWNPSIHAADVPDIPTRLYPRGAIKVCLPHNQPEARE